MALQVQMQAGREEKERVTPKERAHASAMNSRSS